MADGGEASSVENQAVVSEVSETPVASMSVELEKYWKTVRETPSDFTGWTYLLQYVEQENDIIHAREAFDAFFSHYPYCYGYWKKYADLEKRNDNMAEAEQVYERGLKAIALSVDLWLHYIAFYRDRYGTEAGSRDDVRRVYERAILASGTEFRSDKLWESYINWEEEGGRRVMALYDRLLSIPTQLYSHHFENFKTFASGNSPLDFLSEEEFSKLKAEVVAERAGDRSNDPLDSVTKINPSPDVTEEPRAASTDPEPTSKSETDANTAQEADSEESSPLLPPPSFEADRVSSDAPPGDALPGDAPPGDATIKAEDTEMVTSIRSKVIDSREKVHRLTEEEVSKRWAYEEGIRRPYFHVKALEKTQLKNWRDYLAFEKKNGTPARVVVLFERCMIACALYEDMWLMYAWYLDGRSVDGVRSAYERACKTHLPKKVNLNIQWAAFEESQGNPAASYEILNNLERVVPGLTLVAVRKLGLRKRHGTRQETEALYRQYLDSATSPACSSYFAVKYGRYLAKVCGEVDKAKEVLKQAITKDPANPSLFLQLLDWEYQGPLFVDAMPPMFDLALNSSDLSVADKLTFSKRKVEYLEEFAADVNKIIEARDQLKTLTAEYSETADRKRKADSDSLDTTTEKKSKTDDSYSTAGTSGAATGSTTSAATTGYGSYNGYSGYSGYGGQGDSSDYYSQWGAYNSGYYGAWGSQSYGTGTQGYSSQGYGSTGYGY